MSDIVLFGEDHAHEIVMRTLITRFAEAAGVAATIAVRSARGGHGRMLKELKSYVKELRSGHKPLPELLVVVRDANCRGHTECKKEIANAVIDYQGAWMSATPDPHIERWLLLDAQAFKSVLGKGCQIPAEKCNRDRYKKLLDEAVRSTGIEPLLGGIEFAEDIIKALDPNRAGRNDSSFAATVADLCSALKQL